MSLIYRQVSSYSLELTTLEYLKKIQPNQAADKAFQANEFTRWTEEQGSSYMTSMIRGMAPSKFIFCDVQSCYKAAIEDERKVDVIYFKKWLDAGVSYLNLDSNNRSINISAFVTGQFGIEEAMYSLNDIIQNVKKNLNDKLILTDNYEIDEKTTMPKSMANAFLNSKVSLQVYTDVTRDELSEIFIRINDGKPLNDPEKRNAMTSEVANVVRELSEEYRDRFFNEKNKWFNLDQQNRRGLDDFIAGMCHVFVYGIGESTSPNALMKTYKTGSEADVNIGMFKKRFNQFMKWVSEKDLNAISNRNSIFDLWIIFIQMKTDKKEIKSGLMSKFIKHYIKVVGQLIGSNDLHYTSKTAKEPKTFETILGGRSSSPNNIVRNKLLCDKIDFDEYFVEFDSQRVVNDNVKLAAAARDDFKTPEGKDIDLSELQTKKYHKGHIKNYRDGNKTNLKNTVIQEAKDNLKQGKKDLVVDIL